MTAEGTGELRLSKLLAQAGLASRRAADELIAAGRVRVDGEVITRLGTRIDPATARVEVDGKRVTVRDDVVYLALNKPTDVLSAMSDTRGRRTVSEYLKPWQDKGFRIFHVGRLDADTEGLLLITGDGPLAHKLAHPSFGVPKTYLAEVTGAVPRELGRRLRAGIVLDDGPVRVDDFRVVERAGAGTLVEVVLHEGRNRIVRRLLEAVGHPVRRLVRTRFGPIRLGGQRVGTVRELSQPEIGELYAAVEATVTGSRPRSARATDRLVDGPPDRRVDHHSHREDR